MSLRDLLVGLGGVGVGWWIIRSVMEPGIDLLEEGRKALNRGAEGMRPPARTPPPPGPRPVPRVVKPHQAAEVRANAPRPGAAAAVARAARSARPQDVSLNDWFLILDVSPSAGRREIQEAAKLRLARARSAGDSASAAHILRAAATGIGQRQRNKSD